MRKQVILKKSLMLILVIIAIIILNRNSIVLSASIEENKISGNQYISLYTIDSQYYFKIGSKDTAGVLSNQLDLSLR